MFRKIIVTTISSVLLTAAVGDKAYTFNLPQLTNSKKMVKLDTKKGSVVLLNMWASWCPGCKEEMPLLDEIAVGFKKEKFKLIAVNVDNNQKSARTYLKKFKEKLGKKSSIIFLYDKNKRTTKEYNVDVFPMTVLIKEGKVIKEYKGSFKEHNKQDLIDEIKKALK